MRKAEMQLKGYAQGSIVAEPGLATHSGSCLPIRRGPSSHCCSLPKTMPIHKASAFFLTPGWAIKTALWIVAFCPSVGLVSKIIRVLTASCLPELSHSESNCDTPAWFMGFFIFPPKHSTVMSPLFLWHILPCIPVSEPGKIIVTPLYPPCSVSSLLESGAWWLEKTDPSANPWHCWSCLPQIFLKYRQIGLLKALGTWVKDRVHRCDLML